MSKQLPVATSQQTIEKILDRAVRDHVPIRKTLLQQGTGKVRTPGPLAQLCRRHDERALDLYLIIHAIIAGTEGPPDTVLPAAVWARTVGMTGTANGRSAVSKSLHRLEDLYLISRSRSGNRCRITLLDESGRLNDAGQRVGYMHPASQKQRYFKLPHAYWTEGWHLRLDLAAKTMLLIALSLPDDFILPAKQGPAWYGVSPDTVQRGVKTLVDEGIVVVKKQPKLAPLSELGYTMDHHYTITGSLRAGRRQLASVTLLRAGT